MAFFHASWPSIMVIIPRALSLPSRLLILGKSPLFLLCFDSDQQDIWGSAGVRQLRTLHCKCNIYVPHRQFRLERLKLMKPHEPKDVLVPAGRHTWLAAWTKLARDETERLGEVEVERGRTVQKDSLFSSRPLSVCMERRPTDPHPARLACLNCSHPSTDSRSPSGGGGEKLIDAAHQIRARTRSVNGFMDTPPS